MAKKMLKPLLSCTFDLKSHEIILSTISRITLATEKRNYKILKKVNSCSLSRRWLCRISVF